jgi:hypothetical protein
MSVTPPRCLRRCGAGIGACQEHRVAWLLRHRVVSTIGRVPRGEWHRAPGSGEASRDRVIRGLRLPARPGGQPKLHLLRPAAETAVSIEVAGYGSHFSLDHNIPGDAAGFCERETGRIVGLRGRGAHQARVQA